MQQKYPMNAYAVYQHSFIHYVAEGLAQTQPAHMRCSSYCLAGVQKVRTVVTKENLKKDSFALLTS